MSSESTKHSTKAREFSAVSLTSSLSGGLIHHEHLFLSLLDLITIMDVLSSASTDHTYTVRTIY